MQMYLVMFGASSSPKGVILHGEYHNPASTKYGGRIVHCDKCLRPNLVACIGYRDKDLCLRCASSLSDKLNQLTELSRDLDSFPHPGKPTLHEGATVFSAKPAGSSGTMVYGTEPVSLEDIVTKGKYSRVQFPGPTLIKCSACSRDSLFSFIQYKKKNMCLDCTDRTVNFMEASYASGSAEPRMFGAPAVPPHYKRYSYPDEYYEPMYSARPLGGAVDIAQPSKPAHHLFGGRI